MISDNLLHVKQLHEQCEIDSLHKDNGHLDCVLRTIGLSYLA